jgi:hypothetical protein
MFTGVRKGDVRDRKVADTVVRYARVREDGGTFTTVAGWIGDAWVHLGAWPMETPPRDEVASAIAGMKGLFERARYAGV